MTGCTVFWSEGGSRKYFGGGSRLGKTVFDQEARIGFAHNNANKSIFSKYSP